MLRPCNFMGEWESPIPIIPLQIVTGGLFIWTPVTFPQIPSF
jgi:hypothetical protein